MIPKGERVEVFKGDPHRRIARRWYWHHRSHNGEVTAQSEGYTRRRSAIIAAIKEADGRMTVYAQDRRGVWVIEREGPPTPP